MRVPQSSQLDKDRRVLMAGEWEAHRDSAAALASFSSPILPLPSMGCCEARTGLGAGDLSSGPGVPLTL